MINIKNQVTTKKGIDCTEEWLCLVGLRDQLLKTYRVKKDVYTINKTGEKIELHKHGMNYPNRGRVELFYVVQGDKIPTEVFKLVAVGNTHPSKKLIKEANKYVSNCLLERLKKIEEEEAEEEVLELDDLEIEIVDDQEEEETLELEEEEYITI